jgi:uncharacterized flavoprotein (TIGR03862 family)
VTQRPTSTGSAAIIGGGPAGLMAAEVLVSAGLDVAVFDQRRSFGRKLVLAGRGGLNITHSEPLADFAARYREARPQIEPALDRYGPSDLRGWCAGLGQPTFVGSSGRVFPEALGATPLLRAWLRRLDQMGVEFRPRHRWLGLHDEEGDTVGGMVLRLANDDGPLEVRPDITILSMGGASWPRVGGDGSWTAGVEAAGVEVTPLSAANCGWHVGWSAPFVERFEGQPLKNVLLTVGTESARGDCVVTSDGLEGGPVYALTAAVRQAVVARQATVSIDLAPDLSIEQLRARLERRRPKDSTSNWLRRAGIDPLRAGILRESTSNRLPPAADEVAALVKGARLPIDALAPIERAISTAGGVSMDEVDDSFMLRCRPGVFVAGEMLDWEAPTGGYLLQACFSTGVAAANGAIAWLARS